MLKDKTQMWCRPNTIPTRLQVLGSQNAKRKLVVIPARTYRGRYVSTLNYATEVRRKLFRFDRIANANMHSEG